MKRFIKIFAYTNVLVGITLIVVPIGYLILKDSLKHNIETISVSAKKETAIIEVDPINSTKLIEQVSLNVSVDFEVPNNSVADYGNSLKVDSIGLNTKILESKNVNAALEQGIWRMTEYGTPDFNGAPTILAAHRWGLETATQEFREENLFFNLPNVKVGDEISINWFNSTYNYKVVKTEINTYVSQLNDLILITCNDIDSDERVIVYAEKI